MFDRLDVSSNTSLTMQNLAVPSPAPLFMGSTHPSFAEHCYFNELMGELLPVALHSETFATILDVHCRSGEWLLAMARRYPHAQCIGIDSSSYQIELARAQAHGLSNVTFLVKDYDMLATALVEPRRFDLVHLSFCATNPAIERVCALVCTLIDLCRPGGYLLWQEAELPLCTGLSCQHFFSTLLARTMQMYRKESEAGNVPGITAHMAYWLRRYGCGIIEDGAHLVDASQGTCLNRHFIHHFRALSLQMKDLILMSGLIWERAYDGLCHQALSEIQGNHFCMVCFMRTVLARRED
jgi:SAM-dependent methyltransferase